MNTIESLTLDVPDTTAAQAFYDAAFGLDDRVRFREAQEPSDGFRGYTVSVIVGQPSTAQGFLDSALEAGATSLKPGAKGLWGYGGVVQAPDGAIWKVATSSKKDTGPATRTIDELVLLLGVADLKATKQHCVDRGFEVRKSFGRKYADFKAPTSAVTLGLYGRGALAKDAGVAVDGSGSHRLTIHDGAGAYVDADGFTWQ